MSKASEELAAWIAIGWLSRNTVASTLCSSKFVPDMSMARRNSMIDLAEVFLSQKAIVCVYTMSFPCKSRPSFASSILDSGGPSAGLAFVDQRIDDDTVKLRRQQLFSLSPEVGRFFFCWWHHRALCPSPCGQSWAPNWGTEKPWRRVGHWSRILIEEFAVQLNITLRKTYTKLWKITIFPG